MKELKEPIEYFDILEDGIYGKLYISKRGCKLKYKVLKIYIIDTNCEHLNNQDAPYNLSKMVLVYESRYSKSLFSTRIEGGWIIKDKWVNDFYRMVEEIQDYIGEKERKENGRIANIISNYY